MTLINLTTLFGSTPLTATTPKQQVGFKSTGLNNTFQYEVEPNKDGFNTSPLNSHFKSKAEIEQLAKSSPRIMALLKEYNLPLRVNMDVLEEMR